MRANWRAVVVANVTIGCGLLACGGGNTGGGDAGRDGTAVDASLEVTCEAYCAACPALFKDVVCANLCGGDDEIATTAGCAAPWRDGWACVTAAGTCVAQTTCDDAGLSCSGSLFGTCEPASGSFANCVEAYCRQHVAECQAVATKWGIPL